MYGTGACQLNVCLPMHTLKDKMALDSGGHIAAHVMYRSICRAAGNEWINLHFAII